MEPDVYTECSIKNELGFKEKKKKEKRKKNYSQLATSWDWEGGLREVVGRKKNCITDNSELTEPTIEVRRGVTQQPQQDQQ